MTPDPTSTSILGEALSAADTYGVDVLAIVGVVAALLYILAKYLPSRDKEAREIHERYAKAMETQAIEHRATTDRFIVALDVQRKDFLEELRDSRKTP